MKARIIFINIKTLYLNLFPNKFFFNVCIKKVFGLMSLSLFGGGRVQFELEMDEG